jgi:hypothetical protein
MSKPSESPLSTHELSMKVAHTYRPLLIRRLQRNGMTATEADEWLPLMGNPYWTRDDFTKTALAFKEAGYSATNANEWIRLRVTPLEVTEYKNAKWTATDLLAIRRALHETGADPGDTYFDPWQYRATSDAWLATRITGSMTVLYIRAGFTATDAEAIQARRPDSDTTLGPALAVLAALKTPHGIPVENPSSTSDRAGGH